MTASVSIAGGILAGLTFEKLMYLCLQKLLRFETGMKSEFHMETVFFDGGAVFWDFCTDTLL